MTVSELLLNHIGVSPTEIYYRDVGENTEYIRKKCNPSQYEDFVYKYLNRKVTRWGVYDDGTYIGIMLVFE